MVCDDGTGRRHETPPPLRQVPSFGTPLVRRQAVPQLLPRHAGHVDAHRLAGSAMTTPEQVAALYRSRNGARPSPVALGDAMLACRRELGISQCELARRTGITAGTVHHHESVALLPEPYRGYAASGKLRFKEARTLADLGVYHRRNHDRAAHIEADPRFEEIAALFISGRLSSVWVEKVVRFAKDDPTASVDEIVQRVISKAPRKPRGYVDPSHPPRHIDVSTATVRDHMLALAGEVDAWGMVEHCEVERMPVLAAARLLDDRQC